MKPLVALTTVVHDVEEARSRGLESFMLVAILVNDEVVLDDQGTADGNPVSDVDIP